MEILDYALANGNKTLLTAQAEDRTMAVQLFYDGIVAANVTIEVWISTFRKGPYHKIEAATKTLIPAEGTTVILLSGTSFVFVQFRLVTSGATVGKFTGIEFQAVTHPEY